MGGYQGSLAVNLLSSVIDDETISQPVDVEGRTSVTFYVTGTGTTSSGVVTLETSMPVGSATNPQEVQDYAGTWSAITTVNASDVTGGQQKFVSISPSAFSRVRARVSTVIGGGGSISVGLVAV